MFSLRQPIVIRISHQTAMEQINKRLSNLVWNHREHDRLFHKDIYNLPVQDNIRHLVSHLTKYSCTLAVKAYRDELTEVNLTKTLIDTLAVVLSMHFSLRVNIEKNELINTDMIKTLLEETNSVIHFEKEPMRRLGMALTEQYKYLHVNVNDLKTHIIFDLIENTSMAAKAIEALDHLEDYPFYETLKMVTQQMLVLTLVAMNMYGISFIEEKYQTRMDEVEKKHPFYFELNNSRKP